MKHKTMTSLSRFFPLTARISIFIVYFWFGAIKLTGLSPATPMAKELMQETVGSAHFGAVFTILAVFECLTGVLFLIPSALRVAIPLLVAHLAMVCSPLILVPHMAWAAPLVPTMEGQYIIKNVVIGALTLGIATCAWEALQKREQERVDDHRAVRESLPTAVAKTTPEHAHTTQDLSDDA